MTLFNEWYSHSPIPSHRFQMSVKLSIHMVPNPSPHPIPYTPLMFFNCCFHLPPYFLYAGGQGVADDSAGLPLAGNTNGAIVYDSHSTRQRSFIFPTGLCSLTRFAERALTGHLRARGQRRRQLGGPADSPRQPASQPCLGFTPRIIIGWSKRRR